MRKAFSPAVFSCLFFGLHGTALGGACADSLPVEDHPLTKEEMRACLDPKARAMVALHLLGESELTWKDYGEVNERCSDGRSDVLSSDPVEWAAQAVSCPSPKSRCGCPPDQTLGTRFTPDEAEAASLRAQNLALIKQEAAIVTKEAIAECQDIRSRLQAMNGVKVKRKCNSLR